MRTETSQNRHSYEDIRTSFVIIGVSLDWVLFLFTKNIKKESFLAEIKIIQNI